MFALFFRFLPVVYILFFTGLSNTAPRNPALDEARKEKVILSVSELLEANYVYPEVAEKMINTLQKHWDAGDYAAYDDPEQFAERLTTDLFDIAHDKHLRVRYDNPSQDKNQEEGGSPVSLIDRARKNNFGFHTVKVLDGNVGYLDLRGFYDARYAEETAYAAMEKLINTDVLLIDLRHNGGGSPSMIQLLTSYFYDEKPVHLNTFYWRPQDSYSETWTLAELPGKRRPDWKIYVITSSYTFSAAEEFSYNLKHLERATLIGETTGGGAHPGELMKAVSGFSVWVPKGRAINPITGTNWEGTGVIPHVEVKADEALYVAYQKAIQDLFSTTEDGLYRREYTNLLKQLDEDPEALFNE